MLPKEFNQRIADIATNRQLLYYKELCKGKIYRDIGESLGVTISTVCDALTNLEKKVISRGIEVSVDAEPQSKSDKKPMLILPDLHGPYHHPDAIEFFKWVQETRGCREEVQSVGDIVDFHSMSRFVSETDSCSPEDEYEKALAFTSELTSAFPVGNLVLGNHDQIPQRQMKDIGLPTSMLKTSNELYGLPRGWKINPLYNVIEPDDWDILVEHGIGSGGKYGCANTAIRKRCSYVQGHTHSAAAVIYNQNHNSLIFGMNVGCCVDSASLAMRYGKYGIQKGVIGCGVVYNGSHAEFVPMESWKQTPR